MDRFQGEVEAALEVMRGLFPPTPLQKSTLLSDRYGAEIWLKREDLSPVRSYKIRGAVTAMGRHLQRYPDQRQFVAASAGNHAQGVAFACREFGVTGTIFMPVTTPQQKIFRTRTTGAGAVELRLTGDYFDDTLASAQAFCAETGAHFLSPFDDDDVICGQATVTAEVLGAMAAAPDLILLPVGGGGLSAGARRYLDAVGAAVGLRLVEPAGGASLAAALAAGTPVRLPELDGFVDGAAVAQIGDRPFATLAGTPAAHVIAAAEDRLCATLIEMLNIEGLVLEPAGALAIDALRDIAGKIAGKRVVCVTSGGNFDFDRLPEVKERALRYAGIKKYFILRLPQRPGALREFLALLGSGDDITRFEYLKKSARNFGTVLIGIETDAPANFPGLFAKLDAGGFTWRDITADPLLAEFLI